MDPQIRTNTMDCKKQSVWSDFVGETGNLGFTMKLRKISDESESPKCTTVVS